MVVQRTILAMNLSDKANQLKKQLGPGVWEDQLGQMHFSIPDMLKHHGLEVNEENRQECLRMMVELMKKNNPNTELRYRKSPTDDGEDIR